MPLNPPTAIDRRGLTPLANYDGSHSTLYPNGGKPTNSWQYPDGYYPASRMDFQFVAPTGDETDRSAYKWAHTQIDYDCIFLARGGSFPHHFELKETVEGVTIEKYAPSWNPFLYCGCRVKIDRTVFQSGTKTYTVVGKDQAGAVIEHTQTVTVDDSKFVFMSKGQAGASPTGTYSDPYDDLADIYTNSESDNAHAGKLVIGFNNGSAYTISNFDAALDSFRLTENKPSAIMALSGDTIDVNIAKSIYPGFNTGESVDFYFRGMRHIGSPPDDANSRVYNLLGSHNRVVWDRPQFISPVVGTDGSDNTSCIYCSSAAIGAHKNLAIMDAYWEGLPFASNGVSMFDFYSVENFAIAGGVARDSNSRFGFWLKSRNTGGTLAGLDAYDTIGQDINKIFDGKQSRADEYDPDGTVQFVGCKGFCPGDSQFDDYAAVTGDTNDNWGNVFYDRCTLNGTIGFEGSAPTFEGTATITDTIAINNNDPVIHPAYVVDGNVSDSRANAGNYIDGNGDVLTSRPDYGQVGANFNNPEAL